MARAMWKASLRLGDYELPVKLYAAVEDRSVHFRLLHAKDHVPVAQRMVDPATGAEVPGEEVRRAVELDRGVFVVLRPQELAEAMPKASRRIEVTPFVPRPEIDVAWYSRPYLLGPDGKGEEYFALARALEESGRYGVARWVMRGKRYFGALGPREGRLALVSLRPAEEVVAVDQLTVPAGPEAAAMEESGRAAIARFVMRGKAYAVAIFADRGILRAEDAALRRRDPDREGREAPRAGGGGREEHRPDGRAREGALGARA